MLKEIQPAGRGTQPGTADPVGEFQNSETASAALPSCSDSPSEAENVQKAAGNCGTCATACQTGSDLQRKSGFFAGILILFIRIYQKLIAPLLPDCCRFEPTCSHYAVEALQVHGLWKGTFLTIWRLMRCQPFCKGGYDPVPPRRKE